jgi:hypothetical protein
MGHYYYTLLTALPPLPRFDRAERLPINRERLWERLKMLEPEDAEIVNRAVAFLSYRYHPAARTDQEMVAAYHQLMEVVKQPGIRAMFEFTINLRTIMAALRLRHQGLPLPAAGGSWGVSPYVRHLERNWEAPDFKLAAVFPWIPQARAHLAAGEALPLRRLLFGLIWDYCDRAAQDKYFQFEAVIAYLHKWDLVNRWLAHNVEEAQIRFEELVLEVTHEHARIFS